MALASTSNDYGSLKLKNEKKNSTSTNSKSDAGKNLDFYESMYHFKKMFPKFDPEVIETVLRANDGAVDKTIDQLLAMSVDNEELVERMFVDLSVADSRAETTNSINTNDVNTVKHEDNNNNQIVFNDLPPSYNEFIASKMAESSVSSFSSILQTHQTSQIIDSTACEASKVSVNLIGDSLSPAESSSTREKVAETPRLSLAQSIERSLSLTERKSRVLIGELPNSFLRIKLTSDQVKKFKTNIKKAKREEITAILNNKPPEGPAASREIKKKLNMLNEQVEPEENKCDKLDTDWESRYRTMSKMYETRRLQIIQDEYLAKLMQNEEFLNEIKTNNDFMQTLHQESNIKNEFDYSRTLKSSEKHVELSNAELKNKLLKMGKASKVKLAKLGTAFTRKNKYREAVEQSKSTCSNLFADMHRPNPLDEDNDDYYYESRSSTTTTTPNILDSPLDYAKPSRYQKAYKSFKSVLRRHSTASSIPVGLTIRPTRSTRSSIVEEDFFAEQPKQQDALPNLNSTKFVNDLIVFDNEYSYEDTNKNEINQNNFDFSTYPYTKTVSSAAKTSKK